ncbi:hypothetical protein LXL04_036073 [Taraxacum kok-saghyz]
MATGVQLCSKRPAVLSFANHKDHLQPVFSHGQLYVALSRGISRGNTKVLVKPVEKSNVDEVYTSNVMI